MIKIKMVMMRMMIIAIMIMVVSRTMMIIVDGAYDYEGDNDFTQVLRACVKAEREVAPIIQRLMIIISIIIIIVISSNYTKVYHYH